MKKRNLKLFCLAFLTFILSLSSCKKNNNIKKVISENYYTGINADNINELEYISHLECTDDSIYAVGPLSNLICDKVIDMYGIEDNGCKSVNLKLDDCNLIDAIYADDSFMYVGYRDRNSKPRAGVFRKLTGEKIHDISLSDEHYYVYSVFKDSSGNLCFHMLDTSGLNLESVTKIYDQSLNYQSEINLCEKMALPDGEKPVKVFSDMGDGYYILTLDTTRKLAPSVYRVSEDFETTYCINDFSDMNGELENACINADKDLLIIFKETDTDTYFINKICSENGQVSERYQCNFDDYTFLTGNIHNSSGQSSNKYDFYISKSDGIYGYILKTECSEKICDNVCEQMNRRVFIENDEIYIYNSQTGNDILTICKIDETGNVIDHKIFKTNRGYLGGVYVDNNDKAYFTQISDNTQITVCDIQSELYTVTSDEKIDRFCDLYTDSEGVFHIGYITFKADTEQLFLNYIVCDEKGKVLFNKKNAVNSDLCGVFPSQTDSNFKMIYINEENKFVVNCIDYKTGKENITTHGINSDTIQHIYKGDSLFDFYYSEPDAVYGYKESERKSEEIINWTNSQLYVNPDIICLRNNGSLVCTTINDSGLPNSICFLNKADKETVQKLKNRAMINVTAFNASENLKKAVNRYNNSNTDYLIRLNEESNPEEFDKSVVSGNNPDIVLWNNETDMSSYLRNGFFTDLNSFFEKNQNISSDDILANIYDACTSSGKTKYILLDFMSEALVCDRKEWEIDDLTYDILLNSDRKNIFYDMTNNELLELLVTDNIREFVDFDNNDCNFNTEVFSNILKFIKNNAVSEKFQIVTFEDFEKEDRRFDEDRCFLQKVPLNFSEIGYIRNNILKDILLLGFPASTNMYSHIIPGTFAGISEKSECKEAAWSFVSFLLSSFYQDSVSGKTYGLFPVNKQSFEKSRISMYDDKNNDIIDMMFDYTQNKCNDFISDEHISQIIIEECDNYFNDTQNIDDTIKNINNKVKLYLCEIN